MRRDPFAVACGIAIVVGVGVWLAVAVAACTPVQTYIVAGTTADGIRTALGGYQLWTHGERRRISSEHVCPDKACREAALAPFEAQQAPVLACMEPLVPLLTVAKLAEENKDATAAAAVLPELIDKGRVCAEAIRVAKGDGQ